MCRDLGLDFASHSGGDFGIATAIKLVLPLLIGAAVSGAPLICAAKDTCLSDHSPCKKFPTGSGGFHTRVYKVFEAFQSLEDHVFRLAGKMSASAYTHSTAQEVTLEEMLNHEHEHAPDVDKLTMDSAPPMPMGCIRFPNPVKRPSASISQGWMEALAKNGVRLSRKCEGASPFGAARGGEVGDLRK